jgi:PTH1 family peptidyl-tRNA hydrolase
MNKFLIVGLGNIGEEYANTRHNIGFMLLDTIAKENNLKFTTNRLADTTEYRFKGKTLILVKPSTYMNLSGKAVNYWLQAEKIAVENLLVITDDLALPLGTLRMKGKGSDGGHNGLVMNLQKANRWSMCLVNGNPKKKNYWSRVSSWLRKWCKALLQLVFIVPCRHIIINKVLLTLLKHSL